MDSIIIETPSIIPSECTNNKVYVPTAFSPNGDGINDFFEIFLAKQTTVQQILKVKIIDRWGNMVHSEQNQDPSNIVGWDGSFNGVELTSQVFVYRLVYTTLSNKIINQTGDITLLR